MKSPLVAMFTALALSSAMAESTSSVELSDFTISPSTPDGFLLTTTNATVGVQTSVGEAPGPTAGGAAGSFSIPANLVRDDAVTGSTGHSEGHANSSFATSLLTSGFAGPGGYYQNSASFQIGFSLMPGASVTFSALSTFESDANTIDSSVTSFALMTAFLYTGAGTFFTVPDSAYSVVTAGSFESKMDTLSVTAMNSSLTTQNWTFNTGAFTNGRVNGIVSPVPEPETYALMLTGLGVVGFAARRNRRSASATSNVLARGSAAA